MYGGCINLHVYSIVFLCSFEKAFMTFPKSPPPQHVDMIHHRREHRPSVSRSPTCGSRVNDERLRCLN